MAKQNYYEELDLRYPEIGIALETIDRCKPGIIKFSVPILTPHLPSTVIKSNQVRQDKSNIVNKDKSLVEVSNIDIANYIEIEIPKELCAMTHCRYKVLDGFLDTVDSKISPAHQVGSGSVSCNNTLCCGGSNIDVTGVVNGPEHMETVTGELELCPIDEYRYIEAPSKWLIMFIGGDINRPVVICKLP